MSNARRVCASVIALPRFASVRLIIILRSLTMIRQNVRPEKRSNDKAFSSLEEEEGESSTGQNNQNSRQIKKHTIN